MTPVGETLRRTRLKRNLQLEEISNELKISTRFLQAIESDQYDKLPGGIFAKSFVRQYARLLGLDEEDIAGRVQQVLAPEVPQPVQKAKQASVAPIQVPKVDEWERVGDKRFRWSGWLSAVVLVAVMLVCSAVYAWMQRPKSPVTAQANPPVQSGAQSAPAPAAARVTPPNPDATVHVEITADEAVWMLARADGKYAFSATMDAHTTRTVEGVKEVTLRLGNAGGVTILLNGKSIGPPGPKGQVRTIQLTSGGFQIVPAKPPAVPVDRL